MNKKLVALTTIFSLCNTAVLFTACNKEKTSEKKPRVVQVKTMTVEAGALTAEKNYVGTIEEEDGVNVSFSVLGTVVRVMVDEGQFVKKGQPLAELDGNNIRSAYAMSKATLDQAEDAYHRMKNLYDKGTLPEIKMVEMETQLQKARSAENISRKSLDDIVLRAPWSGFIASASLHEGANVAPGMSAFRLVKIDRVKVCVPIPEREIGGISIGQPLHFDITALGDRQFEGKVVSRGLTANPVSHAYTVRAVVDNHDHALLPGIAPPVADVRHGVEEVQMTVEQTQADHLIIIPQQAVMISGQDKFVWLVKGGKATRRSIATGDITNAGVIVESGLSSGETIIIGGQQKVSEGIGVAQHE